MSVWALSDPHLSFGVPDKNMGAFGPDWEGYAEKMALNWNKNISQEDLVLIPGDISWAMSLDEALIDLKWIDALPGTKVILKGNHDYWWGSASKLSKTMPPSIHFIQNNAFNWNDITVGGARLWDSPEYSFEKLINFRENPKAKPKAPKDFEKEKQDSEKVFVRELERLKLSLSQLNPKARLRIALTHYPPIGADLKSSRASEILESYHINICIFGHLHSLKKGISPFGEARGVRYLLTSADYLDFMPLKVL